MTGIAVLGMGVWGRHLIRVFSEQADVVVCVNRGSEEAHAWLRREHPGVRVTTSAGAAIGEAAVDAVVIATPIPTHADLAAASLAAGKHVFVEKPLATTSVAAERVVEAAAEADRILFVGHTFLFDACFEALHAITRSDPVESIELSWLKHGTFNEPLAWNLLPHEVALASWLTGVTPTLTIVERAAGVSPLDRLTLRLDFGVGGPTGSIEIDRMRSHKTKRARVVLESGAVFEWKDGELYRMDPSGDASLVLGRSEESLAREVSAFLAATRTGRLDRSDGRFATEIVRAIEPVAAAIAQEPAIAGERAR
jgi:predicted dehydrogenase